MLNMHEIPIRVCKFIFAFYLQFCCCYLFQVLSLTVQYILGKFLSRKQHILISLLSTHLRWFISLTLVSPEFLTVSHISCSSFSDSFTGEMILPSEHHPWLSFFTMWHVLKLLCSLAWLELHTLMVSTRLPWWLSSKESTCQCRRCWFSLWVGKIPWRRNGYSLQYCCLGKSHRQRSLADYSLWGCKESDST